MKSNTQLFTMILLAGFMFGQRIADLPGVNGPDTFHSFLQERPGSELLPSDKFEMHHGFSMSMMSLGQGLSVSVGSYTNQMTYWINKNFRLDTDITLYQPMMSSPVNNGNGFTGGVLFQSRLLLKPTENSVFSLSIGNYPSYGRSIYSPFSRTF
ncbi:MAG: hypothetical protein ACE5D8_04300 [Fidelibacterota bacterium]